jgi:cobalt/nickel transport system ATP-binding protein
MLKLENVTFEYPGGHKALQEVSVEFEMGKCYCVKGPNGSGKSTLFRILNGLSFPLSGHYYVDGEEITEQKLRDRKFAAAFHRKIGFVFQNPDIQLFTKTVEDEIAFGLYQLDLPESEVIEKTERYIEMLGLSDLRHRAPFSMSGGEKKRTALAAILAMEPPVLILDEPLSGLDDDGQIWFTDFLAGLKSPDRLIIFASHGHAPLNDLADETFQLDKTHHAYKKEHIID